MGFQRAGDVTDYTGHRRDNVRRACHRHDVHGNADPVRPREDPMIAPIDEGASQDESTDG